VAQVLLLLFKSLAAQVVVFRETVLTLARRSSCFICRKIGPRFVVAVVFDAASAMRANHPVV
jgi:hypothetical protein